mmetsp:Transcript_42705/g.74253  ORF Transcript_42705/g.74253 Transcript_42705/m.74253 type:complete len:116 (+) Transcript_42705:73-420(+)
MIMTAPMIVTVPMTITYPAAPQQVYYHHYTPESSLQDESQWTYAPHPGQMQIHNQQIQAACKKTFKILDPHSGQEITKPLQGQEAGSQSRASSEEAKNQKRVLYSAGAASRISKS